MRRSAAVIFVAIMLFWATAPLLACILPGQNVTAQERECCKKMAEMCGSGSMPQSHTCCKTAVAGDSTIVLKADHGVVPTLETLAAVVVPPSPDISAGFYEVEHHHPPSESLSNTTVLRI